MVQDIQVQEVEFNLKKAITFHKDGASQETKKLFLRAPSNSQKRQSRVLKQIFTRALNGMTQGRGDGATQEETRKEFDVDRLKAAFIEAETPAKEQKKILKAVESTEEKDAMDGKQIIMMLLMSDVDYNDAFPHLKKLLTGGACEIDEGVPLTAFHYDQIDIDDEDKLLGEYLHNFLLTSLIDDLM